MSKSNLQINLEYATARSLLAAFGALPQNVSLRVGSIMAGCSYYFSGRLRRTGERNLHLAFPDLSASERRHLLRGCFQNLGRLLGARCLILVSVLLWRRKGRLSLAFRSLSKRG